MTQTITPIEILQGAVDGVSRHSKLLKDGQSVQIKSKEDLQTIKAIALAWFSSYRANVQTTDKDLIKAVEAEYSDLIKCTSYSTSRDKYLEITKKLKKSLLTLQSQILSNPSPGNSQVSRPDFSPLAANLQMQSILENRWEEIVKCLNCEAPLAATIMMGGLLEALFMALVNKLHDKSPVFKAKAVPKDLKTGKPLALNEWTLNSYIDVGTELRWITQPTKEVGVVLRNYRNFIHPERELSTGITLIPQDARMFWSVFTQLSQQI